MAKTGEFLLEIRDISIEFTGSGQTRIRAVDGVSLAIREGECMAVLGESGSGKSTLARSILGLLPVNAKVASGTIRYRGQHILGAAEAALEQIRGAGISMVFQQPGMALNPFMRSARQVEEVIRAHRKWPWARCRDEARRVLESVFETGLDRICDAYPHELSGGEKQRLSIAQAVACNPQLIIADEPTTALDAVVQASVLQLFRRLKEVTSASMLFLTHNAAILPNLADRAIILREGRLIEEGDLKDIYRCPRTHYTADLLRHPAAQ